MGFWTNMSIWSNWVITEGMLQISTVKKGPTSNRNTSVIEEFSIGERWSVIKMLRKKAVDAMVLVARPPFTGFPASEAMFWLPVCHSQHSVVAWAVQPYATLTDLASPMPAFRSSVITDGVSNLHGKRQSIVCIFLVEVALGYVGLESLDEVWVDNGSLYLIDVVDWTVSSKARLNLSSNPGHGGI